MSPDAGPGPAPDLDAAGAALDLASAVVAGAARAVAEKGGPDVDQVVAYDLAHIAAGVRAARSALAYGTRGTDEGHIACIFVADALADLSARIIGREAAFGTTPHWLDGARPFVTTYRDAAYLASLRRRPGRSPPRRRLRAGA